MRFYIQNVRKSFLLCSGRYCFCSTVTHFGMKKKGTASSKKKKKTARMIESHFLEQHDPGTARGTKTRQNMQTIMVSTLETLL